MNKKIVLPFIVGLIAEIVYVAAVIFVVGKVDIWNDAAMDTRFLIAFIGIAVPIFSAGITHTCIE